MSETKKSAILMEINIDAVGTFRAYTKASSDTILAEIPEYMRGGICRYILLGIKPGSFLTAVIAGERFIAERRADDFNAKIIDTYFDFFRSECPAGSHGTPRKVQDWCEIGGLIGMQGRGK